MSKMQDAVRNLRRALKILEPFQDKEAVPPKKGRHFRTFNGSVVYVVRMDSDGEGSVVVLKGGHKSSARGEKPGEEYMIDAEGYYRSDTPGAEMAMSLLEMLPIDLNQYSSVADAVEDDDEDEDDEQDEDD